VGWGDTGRFRQAWWPPPISLIEMNRRFILAATALAFLVQQAFDGLGDTPL
jgi:hypothetical protein